jgi:putative membrane protein
MGGECAAAGKNAGMTVGIAGPEAHSTEAHSSEHRARSTNIEPMQYDAVPRWLLAATGAVFVWSLIGCHDLFTWFLEVLPAMIALPVLLWLYPRLRFTNLVYGLIAVHATILMIGGHYTYALMPVFTWIKDWLHLDRNYYDRLGHFAQGFIPAFIAREVLLRVTPLKRGKLLSYLVFSCCMAISAMYELFEFAAAKLTGTAADAFLGGQGDVWDTQWDMTWCLIGSTVMLLFFTGLHDRALEKLKLRMDILP